MILQILKNNWKIILALIYAIAVPLYFYNSNRETAKALDIAQKSSDQQIQVMKTAMDSQKIAYDKMFEEYKQRLDAEEERYNKELQAIKDGQKAQQYKLSGLFKNSPQAVDDELSKRYGLNAN
jgi:hypothetical protein